MTTLLRAALFFFVVLLMQTAAAQSLAPDIVVTKVIDAPVDDVWNTLVYLDFVPIEGNKTSLTLRNFGYGQGEEWAKTKAYFERAWPSVMANLEKRFAKQ